MSGTTATKELKGFQLDSRDSFWREFFTRTSIDTHILVMIANSEIAVMVVQFMLIGDFPRNETTDM
jgi:hypothetical protein